MSLARHRFTVEQYHRMGEAGVFHEDDQGATLTPLALPDLRLSADQILG